MRNRTPPSRRAELETDNVPAIRFAAFGSSACAGYVGNHPETQARGIRSVSPPHPRHNIFLAAHDFSRVRSIEQLLQHNLSVLPESVHYGNTFLLTGPLRLLLEGWLVLHLWIHGYEANRLSKIVHFFWPMTHRSPGERRRGSGGYDPGYERRR
jgi:hypothetical protein